MQDKTVHLIVVATLTAALGNMIIIAADLSATYQNQARLVWIEAYLKAATTDRYRKSEATRDLNTLDDKIILLQRRTDDLERASGGVSVKK